MITATTDTTFDTDVLKSKIPVLVDFWAEWCGPCKMIAPVLDQIADEYEGKVKIVKVNVDQNQNTPSQYNVRGIPALILFKDGNVIANKVGVMTKSQVAAFLEEYI